MSEILGILADSHGRSDTTAAAVDLLQRHGATRLVHLGDVGTEEVLDQLAGHHAHVVFGNCDHDLGGLTRYAEYLDLIVDHPIGWLEIDGKTIAFTHGHLENAVQEALRQDVDYLLHGHSHELRDDRINGTRIINPGALFRANRYTAAILEPGSDRLNIVEIPRD